MLFTVHLYSKRRAAWRINQPRRQVYKRPKTKLIVRRGEAEYTLFLRAGQHILPLRRFSE